MTSRTSGLTDPLGHGRQVLVTRVILHPPLVEVTFPFDPTLARLSQLLEAHADLSIADGTGEDGEEEVEDVAPLTNVENVEGVGGGAGSVGSVHDSVSIDAKGCTVLYAKD